MTDDSGFQPPNRPPDAVRPDAPVHPLMRKPVAAAATPPIRSTWPRPYPQRQTRLTWALIAVNVAVFALMFFNHALEAQVIRDFANQPLTVLRGEYWRLLTSMFLHGNLVHIAFNMLALYDLGQGIERRFGYARFGMIYILGGLSGSLLSVALNPALTFSVGASGAVFAIFGAEAAFLGVNWRTLDRYGSATRARLRQIIMLAGLNFAIGFASTVTGGGMMRIDNWAHVGGFAGGALLSYLICPRYDATLMAGPPPTLVIRDTRPIGRIHYLIGVAFAAGLVALLLVITMLRA